MYLKQETFGVSVSLEDANQRAQSRQERRYVYYEEWEITYDEYRCSHTIGQDEHRYGTRLVVCRVILRRPGLACSASVKQQEIALTEEFKGVQEGLKRRVED